MIVLPYLCLYLAFVYNAQALNNGLALTPPMGWLSWMRFRCLTDCELYPDECISDKLFRNMADLMSSEGYLDAGYEYLIIDDCWLAPERDENGKLQPDYSRFPFGMKNLSDYIHSKKLKFGIYQDIGSKTCAGYPGLWGHFEEDAKTFVEWDVDYIKVDGCYASADNLNNGFPEFGKVLNKTNRPIVYSCGWPLFLHQFQVNYTFISEYCNLWRCLGDIEDSYASLKKTVNWFRFYQERLTEVAGPGNWNDPDMLIIGNYGVSYEQSKFQMALWAIMASPLIMSVDLRTIKQEFKDLLLHKEAIAINQDPLGIQGKFIKQISEIHIWSRPVTPVINGFHSYAIAFHNRRDDGYQYALKVTLKEVGLTYNGKYEIEDVFEKSNAKFVVDLDKQFIVRIKPTGVAFLKVTPKGL